MERLEVQIKVPCGYRWKEKKKEVSLFEAYDLLITKKQRHYTKAERCGDRAILYWHVLCCPHCGKESPAYPHFLEKFYPAIPKIPESRLSQWAKVQMTFFDGLGDTLKFQEPAAPHAEYTCPRCAARLTASFQETEILIGQDGRRVYLARELNDIQDVMELQWPTSSICLFQFPLQERMEFDFEKGQVSLSLVAAGSPLERVDLREFAPSHGDGFLQKLIEQNNVVKRMLKRLFQQVWQAPLPYSLRDTSLREWIYMTQFLGFSREFYDAIPYAPHSDRMDESFLAVAKRLHTPAEAMELLKESALPQVKSVRKLFAEKSGLFFYLEECAFLFDLLGDVNLFCRLLSSEEVYELVATLHAYPGIKEFYKDYCSVKSEHKLCNYLWKDLETVNSRAVCYCALSSFGKREEQRKWRENRRYFEEEGHFSGISNSIPLCNIPPEIQDCSIDRYYFRWLRTTNEYQEAGESLDNCLVTWTSENNPVVAIYKGRKIVAAMEVGDRMVCQALRVHNAAIDPNSSLYAAITKWCEKYSIAMDEIQAS